MNGEIQEGIAAALADNLKMTLERVMEVDRCLMVYLDGAVNTMNAGCLEEAVSELIENGYTNLIFNCAALNLVSSAGVGSFASFVRLLKNAGGDIALLMVQPAVAKVLDLLGFSPFLNLKGSTTEAVAFFRAREDAGLEAGLFPRETSCPECGVLLELPKPGRFRCGTCKSIFTATLRGGVFLG